MFEQMRRRRMEHEQRLIEEDAKRAAADPNYKPRFKTVPAEPEAGPADPNFDLKKRLAEERRRHREEFEEQFEDDLYEDELYDDYDDEYDDEDDIEDEENFGSYDSQLDYYYDDDGFAHPVKPKGKFGYDRYSDVYKYHLDP